jgi:hypothetical protein
MKIVLFKKRNAFNFNTSRSHHRSRRPSRSHRPSRSGSYIYSKSCRIRSQTIPYIFLLFV